jgi:hypothetical protein
VTNSPERSLAEKINTWVQIVAIVVGGGWGAYTFIYKEITMPRSAPINVSVSLELKKVGPTAVDVKGRSASAIAVEMQVSMKNPSSRKVNLLPSVWVAYGYTIVRAENNERFDSIATNALYSGVGFAERGFAMTSRSILSVGRLFTDENLKPNETIARTHILHIAANTYDVLEVICESPSAAEAENLDVQWGVDSLGRVTDTWFRKGSNGRVTRITPDEQIHLNDPPSEVQFSHSVSEISLR